MSDGVASRLLHPDRSGIIPVTAGRNRAHTDVFAPEKKEELRVVLFAHFRIREPLIFQSKPALDEDKDKNPNKTVGRPMGTWYPNPEKKYCPLLSPSVPNTSSLFQEFQKKYKKKTQPSTDELTFSANSEITDCPNSGK
ncbi:uncharacterized protein [Pagrus major]|uniref:uncharacterized protein isoform X2 n=1 Tax=Pagrus major TaxID=143350 RepID=UPI003CC86FA5